MLAFKDQNLNHPIYWKRHLISDYPQITQTTIKQCFYQVKCPCLLRSDVHSKMISQNTTLENQFGSALCSDQWQTNKWFQVNPLISKRLGNKAEYSKTDHGNIFSLVFPFCQLYDVLCGDDLFSTYVYAWTKVSF